MKLKSVILILAVVLCTTFFALDASAQISVQKGSFTTNSGTPSFNQTVSGVGFQPKAIIFLWTDQTAEGTAANQITGIGFAAETSSTGGVSTSIANDDNVATTNNAREFTSSQCILQTNSSATADLFNGFLASFDSNGFTITWQSVNPGAGRIIHYIAIGGSDITNAKAMTLTLNSSTGNQSYTGVGFQPNFGLFVTANTTTSATTTASATLALGWAVSTSKRGSVSINADDAVTMTAQMDWNRIIANDRALVVLTNAASTLDVEFDFVSFNSDGITFNQINAPTANTLLGALFLKGGQYDAGSFSARTTTGDDNITVVFTPKLMMYAMEQGKTTASCGDATCTVTGDANMAFGAGTSTDGTAEGSISSSATDGVLNTQTDQRTVTTKVITSLVDGNPGSVDGEADQTALGTTTTINWSNAPGTADIVLWAAIGNNAAFTPSGNKRKKLEKYGITRVITNIEPREYEAVR